MRDCDCLGVSPNPECSLHGLGETLRVYSPSAPPDPPDRLAAERARFEEWYATQDMCTDDEWRAALAGWLASQGLAVTRRKLEPHEDREREATERDEHLDAYP